MSEQVLFYLTRHGETDSNRAQRYAGWSDDRLNQRGVAQAAGLAERLSGEGIDRVFTSPVRRAVETAQILAGRMNSDVFTVHGLHEIELGPWKGLTEGEVSERWPDEYQEWKTSPDTLDLGGREPLADVRKRALDAVDQIAHARLSDRDTPAVVVSHLAVIRVLWLHARSRPLSEYQDVRCPNATVFPVRWLRRGNLETAGPAPVGS